MSAREVISGVLSDVGYPYPRRAGELIIDALKAERIAVVELPKPDSTRYEGDEHEPEDRLSWMPDDDFEVSVWRDGGVQRYGYGWGDIEPLSAEQARTVGLALLAAADAAEAVTK